MLDLQEEVEGELKQFGFKQSLAVLSKEQRAIVERHYFNDMPYDTIGVVMGMSRRTVIRTSKKALEVILSQSDDYIRKIIKSLL